MDRTSIESIASAIADGDEKAIERLRQLASSGDPHALFYLADMTWSGHMVPQDPLRGRLLFEYAAALGHAEANMVATNLLASGVAGKRDWQTSLARLEVEAQKVSERRRALELIRKLHLDANGDPLAVPEGHLVSSRPGAILFKNVLSPDECCYIIDLAQARFTPSMVYNKARELVRDEIRTSDGAAIHWLIEDPLIHVVNRRLARLTRTLYEQGEALQALRYVRGQQYRPHFDYVAAGEIPRVLTALIYLNDGYEGGETVFVRHGIEVKGGIGDVLVFRNTLEDGSPDPQSEHAGKPVSNGTKYLATRWIRASRWIA
jgi:prolyl 4-hydroxylase